MHVGGLVVNKPPHADAGGFLAECHAQGEAHLDTVREALPHVPLVELSLLPGDVLGEVALASFGEEIGRG